MAQSWIQRADDRIMLFYWKKKDREAVVLQLRWLISTTIIPDKLVNLVNLALKKWFLYICAYYLSQHAKGAAVLYAG